MSEAEHQRTRWLGIFWLYLGQSISHACRGNFVLMTERLRSTSFLILSCIGHLWSTFQCTYRSYRYDWNCQEIISEENITAMWEVDFKPWITHVWNNVAWHYFSTKSHLPHLYQWTQRKHCSNLSCGPMPTCYTQFCTAWILMTMFMAVSLSRCIIYTLWELYMRTWSIISFR